MVALTEKLVPPGGPLGGGRPAAYYRAGRNQEAADALQGNLDSDAVADVRVYFFLARARQRLQQPKEAEQALARGLERLKEVELERASQALAAALRGWQERLDEQLLRREAERWVRPAR